MLSTLEMWERFSYYGMRAILSLFMISVLFFTMPFASSVYGAYTGLVYLTPLLGGYLSDRYLGNRKSIMIGGIMMAIGQFTLAFCASLYDPSGSIVNHSFFIFTTQEILFIVGLLLLILGNGFFKPNISSMITFLYEDDDERLDAAFTIFYMGINIGSFIAPLIMGLIVGDGHPSLFKWGFLAAGIGLIIGLIIFSILKNKYLRNPKNEPIGVLPASHEDERALNEEELDEAILKREEHDENSWKKTKEKLKNLTVEEKKKILDGPLTKVEKERIAVIFIMAFFAIFFWSAFEQAGVSLTFFAEQHVDKAIPALHMIVPPEWFQSLDPLSIIIFAPIFATIWPWLYSKGKEPSIPSKIGIGLLILSVGFAILMIPGSMVDAGVSGVSMMWLVVVYLVLAYAELCISPTGQSVVAKLSPARFSSLLMGVWFASSAVSNILAGLLSGLYPDPTTGVTPYLLGILPIHGFVDFFLIFTIGGLVSGIVILLLRNRINAWMHGVK